MNTQVLRAALVGCAALSVVVGCSFDPYCIRCDEGDGRDAGGVDGGGRPDVSVPDARVVDGRIVGCVPLDDGEICNELDDDCDTRADEDFDLTTDPLNCGGCGVSCVVPNAKVSCADEQCRVDSCADGFKDFDQNVPGCEYQCPVFPVASETCNGVDEDCDGMVDESSGLEAPPASLCRTTADTPCEGAKPTCETRGGITTWYCDYAAGVEHDVTLPDGIVLEETLCDGQDGDCDGVADDNFGLGAKCDNGEKGACRDDGEIACDPQDNTKTVCDLSVLPDAIPGSPSAELCDHIDNNCDGIVDNSDPSDPDRIIDDMVHVTHSALDFWIYRYEASRPDADGASAGEVTTRACSNAGSLPWANVGYTGAQAACEAAGFRLCTHDEWLAACQGASASVFPYGDAYEAKTCNGGDYASVHAVLASGSLSSCTSDDGLYDISGNLKEWTADQRGTTGGGDPRPIYVTRGGSFLSPELGLVCDTTLSRARGDTTLDSLGFRCCSDSAP